MSIRLADLVQDSLLSRTPKLIMVVLANFAADDGGQCFPSQTTIAAKASISVRGLRPRLQALERDGWFTVRVRGNGRGMRTQYALNVRMIEASAQVGRATSAKARRKGGTAGLEKEEMTDAKAEVAHTKAEAWTTDDPSGNPPTIEPSGDWPAETAQAEQRETVGFGPLALLKASFKGRLDIEIVEDFRGIAGLHPTGDIRTAIKRVKARGQMTFPSHLRRELRELADERSREAEQEDRRSTEETLGLVDQARSQLDQAELVRSRVRECLGGWKIGVDGLGFEAASNTIVVVARAATARDMWEQQDAKRDTVIAALRAWWPGCHVRFLEAETTERRDFQAG